MKHLIYFLITINLGHHLFAETISVKDLDPNTIIKNATTSQKTNCAPNGESATIKNLNISSDFLTEAIIESANQFYNTPFTNAPQEKVELNGITVFRPNHGITHGVRSAILTQDIVDLLLKKSDDSLLKTWLTNKMATDPEFRKKLSLIAITHRIGREDESDSFGDVSKRSRELAGSVAAFKKVVENSGIKFSPSELEDYAEAIKLDGKSDSQSNSDRSNLSHLLRGAHIIDLVRLNLNLDNDIKSQVPQLTATDIKNLYLKEEKYLLSTGDLRHSGKGSFNETFFKLSSTPAKLLEVINNERENK